MFSGRRMSSSSSSPAGVVARASSSAAVNAGIRQPDWLEMVTPAPPGAMTLPTSSTSKPAIIHGIGDGPGVFHLPVSHDDLHPMAHPPGNGHAQLARPGHKHYVFHGVSSLTK